MKVNCPFCKKELCRVERLRYHITHSVCSSTQSERQYILDVLHNMDTTSILGQILKLLRKNDELYNKNKALMLKIFNLQTQKTDDKSRSIHIDSSTHINNVINDNSTHNSTHIDNSTHITNNITLNLFGYENINYIHVPNYLTDKYDIVKLVKDVHFNKDHPENHNVGIDDGIATIYRKRLRDQKVLWDFFYTNDALAELIQNGEDILTSYDKPLTKPEHNVRQEITDIVEKETSWNCLTEELSGSLHEVFKSAEFPPKLDKC